jgi:excisionase family DNA binding protein
MPSRDWLTVKEAAALLGWHESSVRRALRKGRLRGEKFGRDWRIRRADVDAYRAGRGRAWRSTA